VAGVPPFATADAAPQPPKFPFQICKLFSIAHLSNVILVVLIKLNLLLNLLIYWLIYLYYLLCDYIAKFNSKFI